MQIEKNHVVAIHYDLYGENGEPIESSRDRGAPIDILVGHGATIVGLEKGLLGRRAGDRFTHDVSAAEGYGERTQASVQRVPKKYFQNAAHLRPGMPALLALKDGGTRTVTVLKVGSSVIDVDPNHPLAGRALRFDVEVHAVRIASAEEIAHGHVHGADGQHHPR